MIQRYLGNKNSIADHILREVGRFCQPGDIVCDIFSGTISMSMALKRSGYRVVSNDISIFSYHYANCYLRNNTIPAFDLGLLGINGADYENIAQEVIEKKKDEVGFSFLRNQQLYELYKNLIIVLVYLERIETTDIAKEFQAHYIYNTYTEKGENSYFRSLRGTEGHRRFFTPANGKRIDNILNKIREWNDNQLLSEVQYSLLISILCESIEKISNTQGTYHDFQRELYDERALHDLTLRIPPFDDVISTQNEHIIGRAQDSLRFIKEVPDHRLLYLDPPYNFRQYTSYYFMLNLIADYQRPDCEKISRVSGIPKGWNRSAYNKKRIASETFELLVKNIRAKFLVISFNNEGFISREEMEQLLGRYGKVTVLESEYNAFRGSRNLKNRDVHVSEYLFILDKRTRN